MIRALSFADWRRHCQAEVDRRAWAMGVPASTTTRLRGEVARLELRTLSHPANSAALGTADLSGAD